MYFLVESLPKLLSRFQIYHRAGWQGSASATESLGTFGESVFSNVVFYDCNMDYKRRLTFVESSPKAG